MFNAQIFQILGLIYLSIGLGMLINPGFYKRMVDALMDSPTAVFFSGLMTLIAGFVLIKLSTGWSWTWPGLITLFGWIALIKGIWLLIFPKSSIVLTKKMGDKWLTTGSIVALAFGVWFLILGFRAF